MRYTGKRRLCIPSRSSLKVEDYERFLEEVYSLFSRYSQYMAPHEGIDSLELAHLLPSVPETVIAIYVGINDAVCNKGLVSPFLIRHAHNNVFAFAPEFYSGGTDVPSGTVDVRQVLRGFQLPNSTWSPNWTYVMIEDPSRRPQSLWNEKGYIDTIPAKFEDFTLVSPLEASRICFFIDPSAFKHPVNKQRAYLKEARKRGEKEVKLFRVPEQIAGETDGLVPVILMPGEKLYVARDDFVPCEHAWSNLHPANKEWAVVNENSAIPMELVVTKPPVKKKYAKTLIPPHGSADMTTDRFYRGHEVYREPLLRGIVKG